MWKLVVALLFVVSWIVVLLGAGLALRDARAKMKEGEKQATWNDVTNMRQIILEFTEVPKRDWILVVVGAGVNAVASVWSLYL